MICPECHGASQDPEETRLCGECGPTLAQLTEAQPPAEPTSEGVPF